MVINPLTPVEVQEIKVLVPVATVVIKALVQVAIAVIRVLVQVATVVIKVLVQVATVVIRTLVQVEAKQMNDEIKMSVSSMTRTKDDKAVYVLFEDGDKNAEISLPACKLISNRGFSDEEITQLTDYVRNEQDSIYALAKQINPMKAFLGK